MALTPFDMSLADSHHLLAVAPDVVPDEIEVLASSRWPKARWTGRGIFTISRYSRILGPFRLAPEEAEELGFDEELDQVYVLDTLVERGDPPFPGTEDPTGLARAFPDALPVREEGRIVQWLLAAARRLAGQARLASSGITLAPQAAAAIDLAVYSDIWLEPAAGLTIAQGVLPGFELATQTQPWAGPAPEAYDTTPLSRKTAGHELDREALDAIQSRADAFDRAAIAEGITLDAYAMVADQGPHGKVWIEVAGVSAPPPALTAVTWAQGGAASYLIRWSPIDPADLLREFPTPDHAQVRQWMASTIGQVAKAVHGAVNGVILDEDGFAVSPEDL